MLPTPRLALRERLRIWLPRGPRARATLVVLVVIMAAVAGFAAQQIASAPIQVLDVAGNIEPARQTLLDFGTTGVVQSVDVKPGQSVAAGAVLARLDDVAASAQVKQATDAVITAQAKMRQDAESSPAAQAQAQAVIAVANSQLAESAAEVNYADTARLNQLGVQAAQLALGGGASAVAAGQVQLNAAAANLADIQRNGATTVAADQLAVQSATAIGQGSVNAAAVLVETAQRNLADQERVSQKNIAVAQAGVTAAQAKVTADQARLNCDNGSTPASPTCTPNSTNVSADQAALAADQAAVKSPQANLAQVQATAKLDINQAAGAVANAQAVLTNTQIAANVAVKSAQAALAQAVSQAKQADDQAAAQLAASQVAFQVAQQQGPLGQNALQQAQGRGQQSNDVAAEQLAAARLALQIAQQTLASLPKDALLLVLEQDQAAVDAAQSVLAVVQHTLDRSSIIAPVAGIVDQVNIKAGNTAAPPAAGTPTHAIVLETPNAFQLTAPVRDSIITRVQRGALVQVVPAGSSQTLTGTVTDIAPSATVRAGGVTTFDVTATFEAKGVDVRPGMSARMRISLTPVAGGESQPTSSPVPGEGSAAPSPSATASPSPGVPELPTLPALPTEGVPNLPSLPSIPTFNPGAPLLPSPAAQPVP